MIVGLRNIVFFLVLSFIPIAEINARAVSSPDTTHCLLMGGNFTFIGAFIRDIDVYLYLDNDKIDSAMINCDKDFAFLLKRNKHYCIKIVKAGYLTRSITIDTTLPDRVKAKPIFVFDFSIGFEKEMKGIDDYYLDFPIAHVSYNMQTDVFDYSHKYTAFIKGKLKKTEGEFKLRKSH